MSPHIPYDPDLSASHAADKSSIRTLICLATESAMPLRHIYISSEFTSETYTHTKPEFLKQTPRLYGPMTHPTFSTGQQISDLYDPRPASQIYLTGLKSHRIQHGYTPLQAFPCIFSKQTNQSITTSRNTTEYFLGIAQNHKIIGEFKQKFSYKNIPSET